MEERESKPGTQAQAGYHSIQNPEDPSLTLRKCCIGVFS
jgi:hypothetical protein